MHYTSLKKRPTRQYKPGFWWKSQWCPLTCISYLLSTYDSQDVNQLKVKSTYNVNSCGTCAYYLLIPYNIHSIIKLWYNYVSSGHVTHWTFFGFWNARRSLNPSKNVAVRITVWWPCKQMSKGVKGRTLDLLMPVIIFNDNVTSSQQKLIEIAFQRALQFETTIFNIFLIFFRYRTIKKQQPKLRIGCHKLDVFMQFGKCYYCKPNDET